MLTLKQRKHELEGTPDPFPSLGGNEEPKAKRPSNTAAASLDTESQSAFPSLATATPPAKQTAPGAWGSVSAPRIKGAVSKSTLVSDTFDLSAIDLSHAGNNGKPGTLGEVMKNIMTKFKVKVEASTQRKTGQTTFFVKGDTERDIEKAKRQLVALLSPVVCQNMALHVSCLISARSQSPSMLPRPQLRRSLVLKARYNCLTSTHLTYGG